MNGKLQNFFGWVLLLAGLATISWVIYSSYNIFTAKTAPVQIFKIEKKETLSVKGKTPTTPTELQKEMERMISEQLKELIPAETLNTLLNLIAWSIFAGILIFAGAQISGLGIKMIKK
jgi:hypothetical protein